jgi:alginate O-acetyltransferase complex protein AlgI
MLFNSFAFVCLLAVTFFLYYLPTFKRHQVHLLILASIVFYAYETPEWLLLLLASATINIVTSYTVAYGPISKRKRYATIGVVLNLLLLAFFKYGSLLSKTLFRADDTVGSFLLKIPLPIGISFFTFEGISLVIDVYKEKYMKAQEFVPRSFTEHSKRTMFFISFFPHLVAGPILKAHDFLPQIGDGKKLSEINWQYCFRKLLVGYFLKMVVADNLKDFTYWMTFPYFKSHSSITLVTMLFGYSCQIFADFAGYSLIALGLAGLFCYRFLDNFNFPYISTSFSEFWRRWHISLSSFLKEYLYIPMGGNRKGSMRTYLHLMITMFLGGLWHGAAWSYAVWGTFHGGALAIERFAADRFRIRKSAVLLVLKGVMVFSFVTLAWLLFKLPEFTQVISYLDSVRTGLSLPINFIIIFNILIYSTPVVIYHGLYLLRHTKYFQGFKKIEFLIYGLLLFLIIVNSGSSGSFIYFQF